MAPHSLLFLIALTVSSIPIEEFSTISLQTSEETETTIVLQEDGPPDPIENDLLSPAGFPRPQGSWNNPLCNDKDDPALLEPRDIFVEEISPTGVEEKIRKITTAFVETLKHDKAWFVALLFHIRKEQRRRGMEACNEAECLYKIPCFLSQRSLTLSIYSEVIKRSRMKEGFDMLRRRRRSLEGLELDHDTAGSIAAESGAPVTNCTGVFANYCYNSISCIYVSVLESAACSCMPGYTGLRCDLYDLSITLATLSQFQSTTVDIDDLRPEDSATMYSVLDATARYTYSAFTLDDDA